LSRGAANIFLISVAVIAAAAVLVPALLLAGLALLDPLGDARIRQMMIVQFRCQRPALVARVQPLRR
jgi:hypothetical protein